MSFQTGIPLPAPIRIPIYITPKLPYLQHLASSVYTMVTKRNPFTIHNLPYGIISTEDNTARRCAVAFNEWAVDLGVLWQVGLFNGVDHVQEHVFKNVVTLRISNVLVHPDVMTKNYHRTLLMPSLPFLELSDYRSVRS
jgi:hypothetical protein